MQARAGALVTGGWSVTPNVLKEETSDRFFQCYCQNIPTWGTCLGSLHYPCEIMSCLKVKEVRLIGSTKEPCVFLYFFVMDWTLLGEGTGILTWLVAVELRMDSINVVMSDVGQGVFFFPYQDYQHVWRGNWVESGATESEEDKLTTFLGYHVNHVEKLQDAAWKHRFFLRLSTCKWECRWCWSIGWIGHVQSGVHHSFPVPQVNSPCGSNRYVIFVHVRHAWISVYL